MKVAIPIFIEVEAIFVVPIGKEGQMKNLSLTKIVQTICLVCIIGAFVVTALNVFAVLAASFGFQQPGNYFRYMRAHYWSVALPAAGILLLFPLALRLAFTYETPEERMARSAKPVRDRQGIEGLRVKIRLRPM